MTSRDGGPSRDQVLLVHRVADGFVRERWPAGAASRFHADAGDAVDDHRRLVVAVLVDRLVLDGPPCPAPAGADLPCSDTYFVLVSPRLVPFGQRRDDDDVAPWEATLSRESLSVSC